MRLMLCAAAAVGMLGLMSAAPRAQKVYEAGDGVSLPKVEHEVKPEYTSEAKSAGIEGTVMLSTVVRADGTVGDVAVAKSLDATRGLDQQAVKAMKQWTFKPGTKEGQPVAVRVSVEMTFTLK